MLSATPRRSPSAVSSACAATPAVLRAASRGSRPPSPDDVVDADAGRRQPRRHLVARRFEREAEDVEAAGDVGDGGRRKRGDSIHRASILLARPARSRVRSRNLRSADLQPPQARKRIE